MTWYLKKSDGTIYGPSALETLKVWAMDGRIAPEDAISPDKAGWQPANAIPELDMAWEVDIGNGATYGPVHILALRDHVRDGSVPADAPLRNLRTGQTGRISQTLLQAALEQNSSMQADLEALNSRLHEMEDKLIELQKQTTIATEPPPAQPVETLVSSTNKYQLERDAQKWKKMYNDERESGHRREEALAQRIEELRQNERNLQGMSERLDRRVGQLEKDNASLQQALTSGDTQAHISVQAVTLMSSLDTLSANYDRLMLQLNAKNSEIQEIRENGARIEENASERVRQAEEQLKIQKDEAERIRQQLAHMEEMHTNLVRSYRELNDRFIRAFQDKSHPAATAPKNPAKSPEGKGGARIRLSQ